jgi:alginate O-acetyltransferase complex protein AlgJ
MGHVARRLAHEISERTPPRAKPKVSFFQRRVVVEGRGDILAMLRLPESQTLFGSQQVEVEVVLAMDGRPWRSDPEAEVLVLGDSFTNVFSVATLGWGSGAGLAEQLSHVLQQPVDRIALNAGGASASRRALVEALATNPRRLNGKKVVVYQFAARELSGGDWPVLELPGSELPGK